MKLNIILLLFMALSACVDSNTVSSLTQQDKKIIRSIADSYTNGFLEDDRTEIMGLFSADAVLIPHHGDPPVIGTEAIKDHFWPAESPPFRVDKFKFNHVETEGTGDLAYTRGTSEIEFSMKIDGVWQTYSNAGNFLMILRKNSENKWHISRYIWNDPVAIIE